MTIATLHEIKEGIVEFLKHPTLMGAEWHFIFVIPRGSPIACPQANVAKMKGFGDKARLFAAEIDLHKLGPPQDGDSADVISNEENQPTPSSSHPPRISTTLATLKRKAGFASPSPTEATSSKARLPGNRKVPKARE